ncbi:hypothetical protein IGI04_022312 [Brassica rapa subsp. trilocularis]|uniref:Mitochondrial glycoprotein family protein n=2 Tax=Brassica campestris TaxID=3711 RepID=M4EBD7_BRACM|nr:uncharacterized protein At2g39795, mitochondrial [Brassica rapa]XP_033129249.1 uncharacterized protein At2g39795, mitochondrial [Brassica rapa]KAG5392349.1 hypothetical protein IGI04_022312 [Brassica rapa subsp. trilocularis]
MSRLVRCLRRTVISTNLSPSFSYRHPRVCLQPIQNSSFLTVPKFLSSGSYVSEMRKSAFEGNILRLIRSEIQSELDHSPPLKPEDRFGPFTVDERPGEQWVSLRRKFGDTEDIKIEATMFDGSVPSSKSTSGDPEDIQLHITFVVNIFKDGQTLEIMCSAWPDTIQISKFFVRKSSKNSPNAYVGPEFEEMEDELQDSVYQFLEERGISDDLAVFLHQYMKNKDKAEYIRWMETVKSYVEQK